MTYFLKIKPVGLGMMLATACYFCGSAGIGEEDGKTSGVSVKKTEPDSVAYSQIERLTEVMMHIKKNYVDEKTYEEIINGALHGIFARLTNTTISLSRTHIPICRMKQQALLAV